MKYLFMLQIQWAWETCRIKEASCQRPHVVWFYLCAMFRTGKCVTVECGSGCLSRRWGELRNESEEGWEQAVTCSLIANNNYFRSILSSSRGFPGGWVVKNLPANAGEVGSIPGSSISPGERNGYPLQYSCLEKSRGLLPWRSLVGYCPWGRKSGTWLNNPSI